MTNLVSSELFKLRTTRTFYALMGASLALVLLPTIPVSAFVTFSDSDKPVEVLLFFLGGLVQTFALLIGVLAVTNEFRHGTITPSLLVAPQRVKLMTAKLLASLLVGLIMGVVATGLIIAIVGFFASTRDFANPGDKFAMFVGGSLTTALYAALGVGIGALIRNQVGAVVGALVYIFVIEPIVGGVLSLWNAVDNIMPRYSLGAVSNALSDVNADDSSDLLGQLPGGLLLALYAAIFLVIGFVLTQRRDITA
jgi:ABC-2 type transport system permease protein